MRGIGKLLLSAVSAGALAVSHLASLTARQKPAPFAPTPRKPWSTPRRKVASASRGKRRVEARTKYERQLRKEREIGVDPQFLHAQRFAPSRAAWLKANNEWDRRHG